MASLISPPDDLLSYRQEEREMQTEISRLKSDLRSLNSKLSKVHDKTQKANALLEEYRLYPQRFPSDSPLFKPKMVLKAQKDIDQLYLNETSFRDQITLNEAEINRKERSLVDVKHKIKQLQAQMKQSSQNINRHSTTRIQQQPRAPKVASPENRGTARDPDSYELAEEIGRGGNGTVHAAVRKSDRLPCAIKQCEQSITHSSAVAKEVRHLQNLQSMFIVKLFDAFDVHEGNQSNAWIVMEKCDKDLKQLLKEKREHNVELSVSEVWRFFSCAAAGVFELHKNELSHRDIKPANCLLVDGILKVADFGFVKDGASYSYSLSRPTGTQIYNDPEMKQRHTFSKQCDVWALGCILYELCTYKHPFPNENGSSDFLCAPQLPAKYCAMQNALTNCLQPWHDRWRIYNILLLDEVQLQLKALDPAFAESAVKHCNEKLKTHSEAPATAVSDYPIAVKDQLLVGGLGKVAASVSHKRKEPGASSALSKDFPNKKTKNSGDR